MIVYAFLRTTLWAALAVVVALVGAYLAIDLGLVDWAFGVRAAKWQEGVQTALNFKYGVHGTVIDRGLKILGFSFTVVLGLLGFLTWWAEQEMTLPDRIQKYVDAIRDEHLIDRAIALAPYASRNLRGEAEPPLEMRLRERLLLRVWGNAASKLAEGALVQANSWTGQIKVLDTKLTATKCDRISAHLIVAARHLSEAKTLQHGSSEQRASLALAMSEVSAALLLDPNDMDAVELSARVGRLQNTREAMHGALEKLERITRNDPMRHSRALRFQAEALEERATKAALNNARVKLERAVMDLNTARGKEGEPFERALVNEQLAALHVTRRTLTLAEPYLKEAKELFKHLPAPEGPAGMRRVEALDEKLTAARRGDDEPAELGEKEEDAWPTQPTHVNTEQLAIYREPAGGIDAGRWVAPFTAVVLLAENGDWGKIGKDGVTLGWVSLSHLYRLN